LRVQGAVDRMFDGRTVWTVQCLQCVGAVALLSDSAALCLQPMMKFTASTNDFNAHRHHVTGSRDRKSRDTVM